MLKPSQLDALDRADRELAELRRRDAAAAAREKARERRELTVVVKQTQTVTYRRRSGGRLTAEDINRDIRALMAVPDRVVGARPAPVPDFVVGVFQHALAWERAPVFVHAQYVRDIRRFAYAVEDIRTAQMLAVDALSNAVAHVAGMHSTWSALHAAARRLVNRLECGFGDDEDDIGSLQRLQRKFFQTSALVVIAHFIERRGLKLNVAETVSGPVADAGTVDAAQLRREELRAAIARGDVVWSGAAP